MLREIVFDGDKYGRKWIEILDVANFGTSRLVCRDECHAIAPLKIKRCYLCEITIFVYKMGLYEFRKH